MRLKYLGKENQMKKKELEITVKISITIEKIENKLGQNYYYVEGNPRNIVWVFW